MKFTTVFAVLATLATAVSALSSTLHGTNAKRLAAGYHPAAPVRRGTPTYGAKKHKPSAGINNSCNSGPVQCCNSVTSADSGATSELLKLLEIVVAPNVAVGMTCSPLHALGVSSGTCTQQTVCCENNNFNGFVAIGCSPININLV